MAEPVIVKTFRLPNTEYEMLQTIQFATGENATAVLLRLIRQENERITEKLTSQDAPQGP